MFSELFQERVSIPPGRLLNGHGPASPTIQPMRPAAPQPVPCSDAGQQAIQLLHELRQQPAPFVVALLVLGRHIASEQAAGRWPSGLCRWEGTPGELHRCLNWAAPEKSKHPDWPKGPIQLSTRLRLARVELLLHGIDVKQMRKKSKGRTQRSVTVTFTQPVG